MRRVVVQPFVTLDGFAAGPNQSEENPLGEGGEGFTTGSFSWPPGARATARTGARRTPW